jgi:hypothetical protein
VCVCVYDFVCVSAAFMVPIGRSNVVHILSARPCQPASKGPSWHIVYGAESEDDSGHNRSRSMIGENPQSVADEAVEFEK